MANSNPSFFDGQTPDASVWNAIFTGKVDEVGGNIVNPTISGSIAGTPTFSGSTITFASNVSIGGNARLGGGTTTLSGSTFNNQSFISSTTGAGSTSATGQPQWNLFLTTDNVTSSAANSIANVANYYTLGGSTTGARIAQQISFVINGAADAPGNSVFHQALSCQTTVAGNLGGTSGSHGGSPFGANIILRATSAATYLNAPSGLEVDVALQAGSSANYKTGIASVLQGNDAVESTSSPSVAFSVGLNSDSASSSGWGYGLCFGGPGGWWPINTTTGIMIYANPNHFTGGPSYACASGIDFSAVTFSGYALKFSDFSVTGAGLATFGGSGQNGMTITPGSSSSTAIVVAQNGTGGITFGTGGLPFTVSGTLTVGGTGTVNVAAHYSTNGTQVVGSQITGYGTPTGNSRTASFNGASATLAQTSAQLAQVITDLKTHGLLGA